MNQKGNGVANQKFVSGMAPNWIKQYGAEHLIHNLMLIQHNFPQLQCALELSLGTIRANSYRSNHSLVPKGNRKETRNDQLGMFSGIHHRNAYLLVSRIRILSFILRRGYGGIKRWASHLRERSMHKGTMKSLRQRGIMTHSFAPYGRGVTNRQLFEASTIARGCSYKQKREVVEEETRAVLRRLTEPKPEISDSNLKKIEGYVKRIVNKTRLDIVLRKRAIYPAPSTAACYENSRSKGGVTNSGVLNRVSNETDLRNQINWYLDGKRWVKSMLESYARWRRDLMNDPVNGRGRILGRRISSNGDSVRTDEEEWLRPDFYEPEAEREIDEIDILDDARRLAIILLEIIEGRIRQRRLILSKGVGPRDKIPALDALRWAPSIDIATPMLTYNKTRGSFLKRTYQRLVDQIPPIDSKQTQDHQQVNERALELLQKKKVCRCKVQVIEEFQGKLRSVTIHEAPLVQAARLLNGLCLPLLEKLHTSSAILNGEEVTLTATFPRGKKWYAYSADLSKATDVISRRTASSVLYSIMKAIESPKVTSMYGRRRESPSAITIPERIKHVIDWITGPQIIDSVNGSTELLGDAPLYTTAGALMGLGPSWTVLSILNKFAALTAGISAKSFAVCGDDLVALGTIEQLDKYETNLLELGLVPNKEKSFRGDYAVFCERFCTTQEVKVNQGKLVKVTLRSQQLLRISQAAGTRVLSLGERSALKALSQTDELLDAAEGKGIYPLPSKPLARLARRTARSIAVGQGGRLSDGGGGRGNVSKTTFNMLVSEGVFKPSTSKKSSTVQDRIDQVLSIPAVSTGERAKRSDIIEEVTTLQSSLDQCRQIWKKTIDPKPKSVRKRFNARWNRAASRSPFDVLKQELRKRRFKDQTITREDYKQVFKAVSPYLRVGNFKRAIKAWKAQTSYIPLVKAYSVMNQIKSAQGIFSTEPNLIRDTIVRQRLAVF